jgi:acetoin utilization deacetylase AcuC-like enzyme
MTPPQADGVLKNHNKREGAMKVVFHEDDWGGTLSTEDYRDIGRLVRGAANRHGGACFAILEGGYNHQVLGYNALALIQGLSGD